MIIENDDDNKIMKKFEDAFLEKKNLSKESQEKYEQSISTKESLFQKLILKIHNMFEEKDKISFKYDINHIFHVYKNRIELIQCLNGRSRDVDYKYLSLYYDYEQFLERLTEKIEKENLLTKEYIEEFDTVINKKGE